MKELYAALVKATNELKNPIKGETANIGTFSYQYLDLAALLDHIKPTLKANGLFIIQGSGVDVISGIEISYLRTTLGHESGESIVSDFPLSIKGMGPRDIGAQLTYFRRYTICGLLNIAGDIDSDGASTNTSPREKLTSGGGVKSGSKVSDPSYNSPNNRALDLDSYVVPFGKKYKGYRLIDIPLEEAASYATYLEDSSNRDGKPLNAQAQEFINMVDEYASRGESKIPMPTDDDVRY